MHVNAFVMNEIILERYWIHNILTILYGLS